MVANGFPPPEEVERRLDAICANTGIPGISVVASRRGRRESMHAGVAEVGSSAPLSDQSCFEVSCLMKLFVSLIAHRFMRRGALDPSSPIGNYISELGESSAGRQITLGNLLSHTSGYRGLDVTDARVKWGYSWQKLIGHLQKQELHFPPGEVFSYEHSEHVLVGEILQRLSGLRIDQLLQDELLAPLGIVVHSSRDSQSNNTLVGQHAVTAEASKFIAVRQPAFSQFWRASLPDMTIRLHDVLTVGDWILSETECDLHSALFRQVVDLPAQATTGPQAEVIPVSFGHICGRYSAGLYGHNGSAHGQTVALRLDVLRRTSYAVGVNAWVPHVRDHAIRLVSGECHEDIAGTAGSRLPVPMVNLAGPFTFEELVGTYEGGFARQITVETKGSGAMSMLVGAPGSRQRRISVTRISDDLCEFGANQSVSCTFTTHPVDGTPVLRLGVHSYRKTQ